MCGLEQRHTHTHHACIIYRHNNNKSYNHNKSYNQRSAMSEDNPDYAGPEGDRLRAEAQKYAEERGALLGASKQAFESGDKAQAKELSEKGKEAGRKMEEANKKAAEVILKHRNDGHGDNYLDLHGLFLEEALDAFRAKMAALQKAAESEDIVFEVIPGAGHHSKNKAVIKPKIIEELTNMKVKFEEKNAGSINVFLGKGDSSQQNRAPASTKDSPPTKMEDVNLAEQHTPPPGRMGCCVVM